MMAQKRKRDEDSEYSLNSFQRFASRFGEYEEKALNISIKETNRIRKVFPGYIESPIESYLEHLKLEIFDYDKILTFTPVGHTDLTEPQRRFLVRLKNVLRNNASDSLESRLELHIQALVDNFFEQCKLDDAMELQMQPSTLQLLVQDKRFSTYSDKEGRKNERLVWVLQESKHKNDVRYKNGEVQLVSALIAACQKNYSNSGGRVVPTTMYGVNVRGDEISFLSAQFTDKYILSLFGGLPREKLKISKYPKGIGLKLSNPDHRIKILCLMAELRRYALSIDTSSTESN